MVNRAKAITRWEVIRVVRVRRECRRLARPTTIPGLRPSQDWDWAPEHQCPRALIHCRRVRHRQDPHCPAWRCRWSRRRHSNRWYRAGPRRRPDPRRWLDPDVRAIRLVHPDSSSTSVPCRVPGAAAGPRSLRRRRSTPTRRVPPRQSGLRVGSTTARCEAPFLSPSLRAARSRDHLVSPGGCASRGA
jgi:hypothetical protein